MIKTKQKQNISDEFLQGIYLEDKSHLKQDQSYYDFIKIQQAYPESWYGANKRS